MAKQKGIIPLEGTLGNISFYKSRNGYVAREKTSISKDRIANDPSFQRTRENGSEFGRAGKAGKILRNALRTLLVYVSTRNLTGRLVKEMMRVIHADTISTRGQRNVIDGEAELLQGFEFNENGKFSNTFFGTYTASIDRSLGNLSVEIPEFNIKEAIAVPAGATHCRIISAGTEIDFEKGTHTTATNFSTEIDLSSGIAGPFTLSNTVSPDSLHPLFLALGLEFSQHVNGVRYALNNGAYNVLMLAKVDGAAK